MGAPRLGPGLQDLRRPPGRGARRALRLDRGTAVRELGPGGVRPVAHHARPGPRRDPEHRPAAGASAAYAELERRLRTIPPPGVRGARPGSPRSTPRAARTLPCRYAPPPRPAAYRTPPLRTIPATDATARGRTRSRSRVTAAASAPSPNRARRWAAPRPDAVAEEGGQVEVQDLLFGAHRKEPGSSPAGTMLRHGIASGLRGRVHTRRPQQMARRYSKRQTGKPFLNVGTTIA